MKKKQPAEVAETKSSQVYVVACIDLLLDLLLGFSSIQHVLTV